MEEKYLGVIEARVLGVEWDDNINSGLIIDVDHEVVKRLRFNKLIPVFKDDFVRAYLDLFDIQKRESGITPVRRELKEEENPYRLEILNENGEPKFTYVHMERIKKTKDLF